MPKATLGRVTLAALVGEPWLAVAGPRLSEPDNSADRLKAAAAAGRFAGIPGRACAC
jgi:hypothetical protein